MFIHQTLMQLLAWLMKKIFIDLTILILKSVSKLMTRFLFLSLSFQSSERRLKCRYQHFCWSWLICLQWEQILFDSFWNLLFLNFLFFSLNLVIMLLKLKFFSSFTCLSWSTKAIVISLISSLNLLILMLCIRSKMYDSRLSLRFRRKRLLNSHNSIVFSMFEHLIIVRIVSKWYNQWRSELIMLDL